MIIDEIDTKAQHIKELTKDLRKEDLAEIKAKSGDVDIEKTLLKGLAMTSYCRSFFVDKKIAGIYGVVPSLDDKNIKETVKSSNDWFNKELPLEAIDEMYKRSTKPFKKNTCPKLKIRLPLVRNEIKCPVYNQKRVFVDINDIKENSEMILILHIRGLKFLKSYYYCDCYVSQIKLFQEIF